MKKVLELKRGVWGEEEHLRRDKEKLEQIK